MQRGGGSPPPKTWTVRKSTEGGDPNGCGGRRVPQNYIILLGHVASAFVRKPLPHAIPKVPRKSPDRSVLILCVHHGVKLSEEDARAGDQLPEQHFF